MTALADLKNQLSMTADDDVDDDFIAAKIAAAETYTTAMIGAETPVAYDEASADLRQAILMLAAHWFENREASTIGTSAAIVPMGYADLVATHRKWVF
ncbi:head-tail connector protein [Devosia rhodophyticola]|uniref:Head-tail connector protein n=1 Tax=Devosia rhodophyticola TaxID=3026423 RepID=A0ABY7YWC5_9HYPH|nr:head-tail connector protein [Devosia rhodophyticola]WDR05624.1 head-tail connector protein [Devosia rhodophyticola]